MFTGIIEEIGIVKRIEKKPSLAKIIVSCKKVFEGAAPGDSVSVNGVCLTVTDIGKNCLSFDVMNESLKKSTLGNLKVNEPVNLEGALKLGDKVSGHFVSGHIDCVGKIRSIDKLDNKQAKFEIEIPAEFIKYVVNKGSAAVDGISLTVGEVSGKRFNIYIIAHTLQNTILKYKNVGYAVNVETDIMAKNLERQINKQGRVTEDLLRQEGFI